MSGLRRSILVNSVLAIVIVAALATYGRIRFGSLSRALAYAGGDRLFTEPADRVLGGVSSGSDHSTSFTLNNWTGHSVRLLGSKSSCSCAMVEELPSRLEASQTLRVRVRILVPKEGRSLSGVVKLFTDEPGYPEISFSFSGSVVAPGSADAAGSR